MLETVASRAQATDTDMGLRQVLALQQAEDRVPQDCAVSAVCLGVCVRARACVNVCVRVCVCVCVCVRERE